MCKRKNNHQLDAEIVGLVIGCDNEGYKVSIIFSNDLTRPSVPMSMDLSISSENNAVFTNGSFHDDTSMKITFYAPFELTGANDY